MTIEDDFQRALDADPSDWMTRLVFADWLDERDDPRAEGYRASGCLRLEPSPIQHLPTVLKHWVWWNRGRYNYDSCSFLPCDWFVCGIGHQNYNFRRFDTRRAAEDAAALAFARLPSSRRAELLASTIPNIST